MLRPKIGKGVLNAITHAKGIAGDTPEVEKEALIAAGVPENGVSATQYWFAFRDNDYKNGDETTELYDEWRAMVNASENWETESTEPMEFTYEAPDSTNTGKVLKTVTFRGWKIVERSNQKIYYPRNAFLALFTKMPDENGAGYEEPVRDTDGNATSYIRVNLHKAIISGGSCIARAAADPEGGAAIANTEIFVYPEVLDPAWGTIVGFGVMENEPHGGGDPAIHWGRLTTPLATQSGRIPLFRVGGFKSTMR